MSALASVPPWVVLVPLAVLLAVAPRRAGYAAAVLGAAATVAWVAAVPAGAHLPVALFGFDAVLFHVDALSRSVGLVLAFVAAVALAYAHATGADRRLGAYALAYLGAGLGAVFAGDWLTLVVFWELLAVCATLQLWHGGGESTRAGLRYAVYHEFGGLLLVAGVLAHYGATGTFVYGDGVAPGAAAGLVALAAGLNAGFVGLHVWVVDAYPRPHVAASVVLAAVTTKVGVYALARAFPDGEVLVAHVGGVMVVFGVTLAVLQTDLRRLLSYHVVSQVGYMVAGVGAGTGLALSGAVFHLANNVLYKSLLFMVAGVVVVRTGRGNLKRVGGLAREMPVTFGAFVVAALAIAGAPGFNGFVSKGMVVDGVEAAGLEGLWWLLVVGSVGTVVSFAKFGYYVFLHGDPPAVADASALRRVPLVVLAAACLLFGVAPGLAFGVLPGDPAAAEPFTTSQYRKAGAPIAVGVVGFRLLRGPLARVTGVPDLDAVYVPGGRLALRGAVAAAAAADDAFDAAATRAVAAGRRALAADATARWLRRLGDDPVGVGTAVLLAALALAVTLAALLL